MIRSFRDRRTRKIADGSIRTGFPSDLVRRGQLMLAVLDAADVLNDLRSPPGNQLERLSGDRDGQHSVRINDQWRICFVWTDSGPEDVEITDYH